MFLLLIFRLDCGIKTFRNEGFFGMYRGKYTPGPSTGMIEINYTDSSNMIHV